MANDKSAAKALGNNYQKQDDTSAAVDMGRYKLSRCKLQSSQATITLTRQSYTNEAAAQEDQTARYNLASDHAKSIAVAISQTVPGRSKTAIVPAVHELNERGAGAFVETDAVNGARVSFREGSNLIEVISGDIQGEGSLSDRLVRFTRELEVD